MTDFKIGFMEQALDLARKAALNDEVPVGAVVIRNGIVVGQAHNMRETDQNPVAHAEILAIQEAARAIGTWRLTDCLLVVTLEPCMMCLAASQQARIKEIVFGVRDAKGGALSLGYRFHEDLRVNHRFDVSCVDVPECGHLLTRFFAKKRQS